MPTLSGIALEPGNTLPADLTVLDSDGAEVRLSRLRGEVALLIYLRHLG